MTNSAGQPRMPTFIEAVLYWLRLGFISFGGPAGQIAIMHRDLVERKRWISEKRFLHALNYCMLLPGPEAQQLATYIGWLMHGVRGGLAAGILFVLPSLLILMLISYLYINYAQLPMVSGLLYGIKPAVVAIVIFAAYRIGLRVLHNGLLWAVAITALLAVAVLKMPFPWVILLAASVGIMTNQFAPQLLKASKAHQNSQTHYGKTVIDDETPTPVHAVFRWKTLLWAAASGLLIWLIAILWLMLQYGATGTLTQMAWFFTKAALLTFGGAYAVLPYIYQGAVNHYAWLTPAQMMDGLALGESTPGPLIMVVAYVGFLGGWSHVVTGNPLQGAILAASVVTFFTFLPSFLFIFIGAPVIESTKHQPKWNAPLTAISAAVVGVIVSLGLFFGAQVFFPAQNFAPDWLAIAGAVLAFLALYRWKWGVTKLISIFAVLGVLRALLI